MFCAPDPTCVKTCSVEQLECRLAGVSISICSGGSVEPWHSLPLSIMLRQTCQADLITPQLAAEALNRSPPLPSHFYPLESVPVHSTLPFQALFESSVFYHDISLNSLWCSCKIFQINLIFNIFTTKNLASLRIKDDNWFRELKCVGCTSAWRHYSVMSRTERFGLTKNSYHAQLNPEYT